MNWGCPREGPYEQPAPGLGRRWPGLGNRRLGRQPEASGRVRWLRAFFSSGTKSQGSRVVSGRQG